MNPVYLQVSIKWLSSQDWRYCFIITTMLLKPITKTPIADYEKNQFYLGLYLYKNTILLKELVPSNFSEALLL